MCGLSGVCWEEEQVVFCLPVLNAAQGPASSATAGGSELVPGAGGQHMALMVPLPPWQHTEALLYGFQSIAETIDVNYSDVVPGLIGLIPRISISNVQLADTVMFTIGEAFARVQAGLGRGSPSETAPPQQ